MEETDNLIEKESTDFDIETKTDGKVKDVPYIGPKSESPGY